MIAAALEQRAALASLARHFPYEEILLGRVFEEDFGAVEVDRWPEPQTVGIHAIDTVFLIGDATTALARDLARRAPQLGTTLLLSPEEAWAPLLVELHGERSVQRADWTVLDGSFLGLDEIRALETALPDGYTARRMTADDAARLEADHTLMLQPWWSSPEHFYAEGVGFVTVDADDRIVASIHTTRLRGKRIRVYIQTQPVERRKHLALGMTAYFIEHCRTLHGYKSWWNAINPDAVLLAESLGFRQVGAFRSWHVRSPRGPRRS